MRNLFYTALFWCMFGSISACSQPAVAPESTETVSEFESPYFSVTVTGSGPDVILTPGLASSGEVWDGTVATLADSYTLHVIQVSGFAGTPPDGNQDNTNILDDLAADLAAYSSTLNEAPILVGHSLGGLVAMKTAFNPDAELRQLVIIDVLPFFSVLMDPAATSESMAPISAMMKAGLLAQSDEIFEARQAEALSALVKDEDNLRLALNWSVESDRRVMAQAMSEVIVTDLRSKVAAIEIPTTIIYARDEAIPNMADIEAYYQALYASVPDHTLIAIENAQHFVMLDQPEAFFAALETAIER